MEKKSELSGRKREVDIEGLMFLKSFWSGGSSERLVRKLWPYVDYERGRG